MPDKDREEPVSSATLGGNRKGWAELITERSEKGKAPAPTQKEHPAHSSELLYVFARLSVPRFHRHYGGTMVGNRPSVNARDCREQPDYIFARSDWSFAMSSPTPAYRPAQ